MKRYLILLLCTAMLLCLAGCNATADGTTGAQGNEAGAADFPKQASSGLEFSMNDDGTACIITGVGECTDVFIRIPDTLAGKPVTEIADSAFYCNTVIRGVILGENVVRLGEYAFFGCTELENVELNDRLAVIGQYGFAGCGKIQSIAIPDSLEQIGAWAFFECLALKTVEIEDVDHWFTVIFEGIYANPLMLAGELLLNGETVTKVTVPEDVTQINGWVFAGCVSLEEIRLHENVTAIGQRAFLNCDGLEYIRYDGTLEQWRLMVLGTYWDYSIDQYFIACQDQTVKG